MDADHWMERSIWMFFRDHASGAAFLKALDETCGSTVIRRFGTDDPPRTPFDPKRFRATWDTGDVSWRCARPWGQGGYSVPLALDDLLIAPERVRKVASLWWSHDNGDAEAVARVFDAVAATTGAYVAFADPEWTTIKSDPVLKRDWWLGLPPVRARRWWFGSEYLTALGTELPDEAIRYPHGAVVTDKTWQPPRPLAFSDFTDEDFTDHQATMAGLQAGTLEWKRERWRGMLWVHPAQEIP